MDAKVLRSWEAPLESLPLVGRLPELTTLRSALENASAGQGTVVLLAGDGGIGKTRLALAASDEADAAGWRVAYGRAYEAESGVPYSVFADAFLPVLDKLPEETRTVITRGAEAELQHIFPSLTPRDRLNVDRDGLPDLKSRLLWQFTQVLKTLSRQKPLLIILEDLQWADASSLEMLHFIARQSVGDRILLLCTYNSALRETNPALLTMTRSLDALGRLTAITIQPLTLAETTDLVARTFDVRRARIGDFSALLYGWTRGNPYFITEVLRALVNSGKIHSDGGDWIGWGLERLELPASIRDAVMQRAQALSPHAYETAETLAAFGRQATYDALLAVSASPSDDLLHALQELVREQIVIERQARNTIAYDFIHPLAREAFIGALGETGAAAMHARLAHALENLYGNTADEHADELAFHYALAPGAAERAVHYLLLAGQHAFDTFANREAVAYLQAALERLPADDPRRIDLLEQTARAQQRLGAYQEASALWDEVRAHAESVGDYARVAAVERRVGVSCFWAGQLAAALQHYERGLAATIRAQDRTQQARIRIALAMCFQELGHLEEALPHAQAALELAEEVGDAHLMGRAHRALLLLYVWNGPPELARRHGAEAIRLLSSSSERSLIFSTHWAIAVLEGLNGNSAGLLEHYRAAEAIAEEVRSPVLHLWTDELAIEYGYGAGDWTAAIERGERAIAMARALNQRMLLPRLLVWTALMHMARDDVELGRSYVEEAWRISGADKAETGANVHVVVPAHTGLASYYYAIGDYDEAIRIGMRGMEIAERSGYAVWIVHRLLPVIAEAHLYKHDVAAAAQAGARLRQESQRLNHKLGLAWADACDALLTWLRGDPRSAAGQMRAAAEKLAEIPFIPDAARIRRQLAGRLAEIGERDAALRELREIHDIFVQLGATRELVKTREMFRELGARAPARAVQAGAEALTDRELEIVRYVLAGKSNKSIGKALDISARTVGTHLSHIFRKLGIASRAELARERDRLPLIKAC